MPTVSAIGRRLMEKHRLRVIRYGNARLAYKYIHLQFKARLIEMLAVSFDICAISYVRVKRNWLETVYFGSLPT